jgi:hypothetical protein
VGKLLKIGIPFLILLLVLVVVGTGVAFARNQNISGSTQTVAADAGYANGAWGYCPGSCGWGGWNAGNTGNYPPCYGYWR